MIGEHHDLVHELPEYRERIHELKTSNNHFSRLFDEYHDITKQAELAAAEVEPTTTSREEELKKRRLELKDELFKMLQA